MPKFYLTLPFTLSLIENDKGEVLAGRHPNLDRKPYPKHWDLPGGKIDKNEQPLAGAIREVKEETGLDCTDSKLIGVFHHTKNNFKQTYIDKGGNLGGLCICYKFKTKGKFNPQEMDDIQWLDKNKLKKLEWTPWAEHFLKKMSYI